MIASLLISASLAWTAPVAIAPPPIAGAFLGIDFGGSSKLKNRLETAERQRAAAQADAAAARAAYAREHGALERERAARARDQAALKRARSDYEREHALVQRYRREADVSRARLAWSRHGRRPSSVQPAAPPRAAGPAPVAHARVAAHRRPNAAAPRPVAHAKPPAARATVVSFGWGRL